MKLLKKTKARLGEFWWYSLMIFLACRSGDVIQAFIGLWLVPKYVGQQELGAVLPLQQLCGLFAVPIAALAMVFAKYVNTYATRGEYGKVKSFVIDMLCASTAVFAVCIVAACILLPHFYLRLKVTAGMLTVLILASGFMCNVSQLFTNALQGLKKFKAITVINFMSAPVRLVTLLVAMPVRALSGYILGQATPPATSSLIAGAVLCRDLRSIRTDTSWRSDLPEILRYFVPVLIYLVLGMLFASVSATVYRQRLPEVESAAYYVISRFAEIATYVGASMTVVLFPLAAEAHEKGKEAMGALKKTFWSIAITTVVISVLFVFAAHHLFAVTETWRAYARFADLLPVLTIAMGGGAIVNSFLSYEIACRRFGFVSCILVVNAVWIAFLLSFTGYDFFRGVFPDSVIDFMASLRVATLGNIVRVYLIFVIIQLLAIPFFYGQQTIKK